MKNFNYSGIALAVVSALLSGASLAAESSDVGEINVKGQSLGGGLMVQEDSRQSAFHPDQRGVEKAPGASNCYRHAEIYAGNERQQQ